MGQNSACMYVVGRKHAELRGQDLPGAVGHGALSGGGRTGIDESDDESG